VGVDSRPSMIAAASILMYALGALHVAGGSIFLLVLLKPVSLSIPLHSKALTANILLLGPLEIVDGWLLWRKRRMGGVLAIAILAAYLALIMLEAPGRDVAEYAAASIITTTPNILVAALVFLGWRHLQ